MEGPMSQLLQPARVVSPGRILKQELEARGLTQKDMANIMGRPVQVISEIIREIKQITPATAIELAHALGTSPEFWLNLEMNYRLFLAQKAEQHADNNIVRKRRVYEFAPITELMKRGWIRNSQNIDDIEQEICRFFHIETLVDHPQLAAKFRCSTERGPKITTQIAWLRRVEHLVEQQSVVSFNRDLFREALPTLRTFAEKEEWVVQIPTFLLALGVHIVFVPHLANTYIDGAAFFLHDRPVIALSLRHNRIDAFWFTLMHEVAHITLEHQGLYLDEFDDDLVQKQNPEIEANNYARDWLIDPRALKQFIAETAPYFSRKKIEYFAREQSIHPGIVLGRLQYDKVVDYKYLRKLLVKVEPFLHFWIDVPNPRP
jgi:HTH-type transcriptional regulator / antitoxin HigA